MNTTEVLKDAPDPIAGLYGHGAGVIRTHTGKHLNVADPKPEDICIEDIAHGLSLTCRWGGQCPRFYSVAQHSLAMAFRAGEMGKGNSVTLAALLHDASEGYLGDIPKPIKILLRDYRIMEARLQAAIDSKFGLMDCEDPFIKDLDKQILEEEWAIFFAAGPKPSQLQSLPPLTVEQAFLNLYKDLTRHA